MKRLALYFMLTLLSPLRAFAIPPNPDSITITNITQTSANVNWQAVPGATSYALWHQCTDGSYGFQWCQFATVSGTSYRFKGLQPGMAVNLCVGSDGNVCGPPPSAGTAFFQTYESPYIEPIAPTTYTRGCGWVAASLYGGPLANGVPAPSLSLIKAPSDMWLGWAYGGVPSGGLYWNAGSTAGVTFTLEATNSQGTASETTTLTPTTNPPCNPRVVPARVVETWLGQTTFQWAIQGINPVHSLTVYVLKPGSTCWCADSSGTPAMVKPGVYHKTFTNMTARGTYGVQAKFES